MGASDTVFVAEVFIQQYQGANLNTTVDSYSGSVPITIPIYDLLVGYPPDPVGSV